MRKTTVFMDLIKAYDDQACKKLWTTMTKQEMKHVLSKLAK